MWVACLVIVLAVLNYNLTLGVKGKNDDGDFLPCPLQWEEYSFGDPIPENAVKAGSNQYIIRGEDAGGKYQVGRLDEESGKSYVLYREASFVEILINRNKCHLTWRRPKRHGLPEVQDSSMVQFTTGCFIGRAVVNDDWYPGNVVKGTTTIKLDPFRLDFVDMFTVVTQSETLVTLKEYQVLVSQSPGFGLDIYDFTFQSHPEPVLAFMGLDTIYNRSPTEVSQTVTHVTNVTETVTITETNGYTRIAVASATISSGFFGIGGSAAASTEFPVKSTDRFVYNTKSSIVTLSRTVKVPPLTSVEACSTLSIADNFSLQYTAVGKFTLDGRSGKDIQKIFAEYSIPYPIKDVTETYVTSELKGELIGSLAMTSQLIVVPTNSQTGCIELGRMIETYRGKKESKAGKKELEEALVAVNKAMAEITGMGKGKVFVSG